MKKLFVSKNIIIILISIVLFGIGLYFASAFIIETFEKSNYAKLSKEFTTVSVDEIQTKLSNNESFFLYTGRVTCPYCRIAVPILHETSKEENIEIFYLDSENTNERPDLKAFRDSHEIKTVPNFGYFDNGDNFNKIELSPNGDDENYDKSFIVGEIEKCIE